mmetsp:Transcript_77990/g.226267  ORF Transcript_77990/g.226267 Transcript_77990/m.226267 type:complete len:190 (-) Transcript_77990:167-736(-)|eukprot:CAMPEP_0176066014 /NCGR_PEP_ID=MMETSP0120_2-20121206/32941_1 /TAXON_ID=160619 /ORGANISM="Kryptoperidinium foliaceum, Strain CCMP 1326" /LENGTH=189 /DNA_ID=CAMNT_0017399615 /DNA_START=80 /DNA_END=649 /DNA_ORIENTATION=+
MRSYFASSVALLSALSFAGAWTPITSPKKNEGLTRRQYVETLSAAVIAGASLPKPAYADVTNKVASSTALRSVKRSQKQLKDLLPAAQSNDFTQVKAFLRTPPFAEVRKNCFILVRGGEDSPKAAELDSAYKAFIASIEKIDSTASLGIRGRKIPDLQMSDEYQVIESAMSDFIKVAEEAAEVPVQYME